MQLTSFAKSALWAIFGLYVVVASFMVFHHQPWNDELHAFNIAKSSPNLTDLLYNTRYEGHPPAWFIILWVVSKFTHNWAYIKAIQLTADVLAVFLLLFYSRLPFITKLLLPFGYFFLFEFAIFSRNYMPGVLAAFAICIILNRQFKYKLVCYYVLLFFMSNVHLLALLLAGSLHVYFLLSLKTPKKATVALHILLGIIIAIPALYFIAPPYNRTSNISYLLHVQTGLSIFAPAQLPLRALLPMPAWWQYNFWNTQFLLTAQPSLKILKYINPLISLALLGWLCFILRKNKKSLLLFITNVLLTFIVGAFIFTLGSARYSGFIFIGFIVAYWLYCNETQVSKSQNRAVTTLLLIQFISGVFATTQCLRHPFSNTYRLSELLNKVPANQKVVTDYWALITVAAYTNKPVYCIDMQKDMRFVLWQDDLAVMNSKKYRYAEGTAYLFNHENIKTVYMVSTATPAQITGADQQFAKQYKVTLVNKIDGAIEKGSNLYLYQVSSF